MRIWHDRSYIGSSDKIFVTHGMAENDFHSVRFSFVYTEEQQKENARTAKFLTSHEWSEHCTAARRFQSDYMFPVMDAIAERFMCYQFDKTRQSQYDSDEWEMFFWCNDLYNTTGGKLSGRDYSYFTLSFNERHTTSRHQEICERLLEFLAGRFSTLDNLSVAVQHKTRFFEEKIEEEAKTLAPRYYGTAGSYRRMNGRFINSAGRLIFMKKYARSHGYVVGPHELLMMSWMKEQTAA